jgi:hypothetical protein
MRRTARRSNAVAAAFLAVFAFCSLFAAPAHALETGVRHRIDAVVGIEPGSSLIRPSRVLKGTLTLFVRLSANSRESRYFGVLSPTFSDIVVSDKKAGLVAQSKVWEEDTCHQRRGLPKVTVTQVTGSFGAGQEKLEVSSAVRRIGVNVPPDELTPGIKLPDGRDDVGVYYAFRAHTRDSRINVDLKIYAFDCVLPI